MDKEKRAKSAKEDDIMSATAVKIDNNLFNDFLRANKLKIDAITPKNSIIHPSFPAEPQLQLQMPRYLPLYSDWASPNSYNHS